MGIFLRRYFHPVDGSGLQLLAVVAYKLKKGIVGPGYLSLGIPEKHALGIGVHQPTKAGLGPLPLGDIANDALDERLAAQFEPAEADLHRNLRPVHALMHPFKKLRFSLEGALDDLTCFFL